MKLYVTYGFGSNLRNKFSVVEGEDESACYSIIKETCGQAYAFAYSEYAFVGEQQEKHYNLTEVPLQAQVMETKK